LSTAIVLGNPSPVRTIIEVRMRATDRHQTLTLKRPAAPAPVAQVPAPAAPAAAAAPAARRRRARIPWPDDWRPGWNRAELQAQLRELVELVYPVFLLDQPVPLTLGADKWLLEVAKPGCEPRILPWLIRWCRTSSYLRALAREGAMRHGPDGHPVEPVSDVHRLSACRQCERRQARRAARAAMMQAEDSI
jgi:hypothetical protein